MNAIDLTNLLLDQEEGCTACAVRDSRGFLTIARGVCVDSRVAGAGLPLAAIRAADAEKTQAAWALAQALAGFDRANPVRQAVVVSMCFQLGPLSGWPDFKAAFAAGDYNLAADNMLYEAPPAPKWSPWHTQTPARCEREAEMMRNGVWVGSLVDPLTGQTL